MFRDRRTDSIVITQIMPGAILDKVSASGLIAIGNKEIEITKNINEFASKNGLVINTLQVKKKTMEQFFKELTKN